MTDRYISVTVTNTNDISVRAKEERNLLNETGPVSRTSVGRTLATVFFLFGAVPDVCTVMRSGHVQQSDVNMIDRWTSADQLAS